MRVTPAAVIGTVPVGGLAQLMPPSRLTQIPPPLSRPLSRAAVAITVIPSGAKATSLTKSWGRPLRWNHCSPPLAVAQSPPNSCAAMMKFASVGRTAIACTRPPLTGRL